MNELVREIEEDIRQERIDRLWRSFGKGMVGLSIAVILTTVAVVMVQDHKRNQAIDQTTQMIKGIDRMNIEDFKGAIPIFDQLASHEDSTYYEWVMLRKAQAELALGQGSETQKIYETLAKRDDVVGALAKLLHYGNTASNDNVPAPNKNAPLYYTQSEFRAWQLLELGKNDQAVDQFMALWQDSGTPSSLHERVTEILQHIAPEKLVMKDKG